MNFAKSPCVKRLTLREKTLLFLCLTLTGLTSVVYLASSAILLGSLKAAEEQSARQSLQGVVNVLDKDKEAFTSRYSDWSSWDDTYTFIQNKNEAYIKSNLVPEQLANLKTNVVLFVNAKGQVVYGTGFDFETKHIKAIPAALPKSFAPNHVFLDRPKTKGSLTGILVSPEGPLLITCQPILTSEGKGPAQGVVIFGRYINADSIANLSKITRFPIQVQSIAQTNLPADFQEARQALSLQAPIFIRPLDEKLLAGYVLLTDIYDRPALILRVDIPREIYQQGSNSQRYLMVAIVLLGLVFGGVSVFLLEQLVLDRLTRLSSGVHQIQKSRNISLRLPSSGTDEISSLTNNINDLLATLEKAQAEVEDALNQVTQTNTDLHTAVNQLQNEILERQRAEAVVRHSETQLKQQTQHLEKTLFELQHAQLQLVQSEKMSSLGQLVAGVAHEINNPVSFIYGNLNYVTEYVQDLLQILQVYRQEYPTPTPLLTSTLEQIDLNFITEDLPKILTSMQVGTERIRDIVRSLRIFSRLDESEVKAVDLHEGIDSTLLILQSRLKANGQNPGILVVKDYGQLPRVECYAGQLNQVFMNILVNAIDAIEEARNARPVGKGEENPALALRIADCLSATITIRTAWLETNAVEIRIIDTGPGMPEKVRSHLFDPFFTTKSIGKGTGLGMSISQQIIVEKHQGTLECRSTIGQGTEFIITIPGTLQGCVAKTS
jgi:two-component system NtrC family sensor kinase